jgi:hypothetical protein
MVENAHHSLPIRITEGSGKFRPFMTGAKVVCCFPVVVLLAATGKGKAAAKGSIPIARVDMILRQREIMMLELEREVFLVEWRHEERHDIDDDLVQSSM